MQTAGYIRRDPYDEETVMHHENSFVRIRLLDNLLDELASLETIGGKFQIGNTIIAAPWKESIIVVLKTGFSFDDPADIFRALSRIYKDSHDDEQKSINQNSVLFLSSDSDYSGIFIQIIDTIMVPEIIF